MRAGITLSSAIFLGALAAIFTVLPLHIRYPILPYLRFEIAEIPVVLALLVLGPGAAFMSSAIYWAILLLVGEFTPIGPTMKFVAVSTMILGLWLGSKIRGGPKICLIVGSCLGCLFRVSAMGIFNYVILIFVFPEFLEFAMASISAVFGAEFLSHIPAMAAIIIFTAIFNVFHVILSIVPAYLLVRHIVMIRGGGFPVIGKAWFFETTRAAPRRVSQRSPAP